MFPAKCLFLFALGALTLGVSAIPAQVAVPAPAAFALVSPAAIAALPARKSSPAASGILQHATTDLSATPHPMAHIHTEGTLPHQGIRDASIAAEADFPITLDLALAYRLTNDRRYLDAADRYLSAWASIYKPDFNPIDETRLMDLILAYDLVRADVSAPTREKMTALLRSLADGYAGEVVKKIADKGNWQSHRVKLLTLTAFALGDDALIRQAHEAFSAHVKINIRPDGSVHDFYQRDALHYVTYDLEPLTVACLAARTHGQDWFDESAPGSVAKGVDWLLPFATGQKSHVEFVNSKTAFDRKRAEAGEGEYGAHSWKPEAGLGLLTLAAAVDPARRAVCQQVATASGKTPTAWVTLLFWPTP